MKRVLIAGATGYLGRYVVKELKKQGYYTRVLVRNANKLDEQGKFFQPSIKDDIDEIIIGEITQPHTLKNICDDVDYFFSSVGITKQKDGLTFEDVDYQGNVNLLLEAEKSQVEKFMYIHVLTNNNWSSLGPLIEAKKRFVERLTASIDHIVIRPTGYFSDMTQYLEMAKKGTVYILGDGKTEINPIHGEDLARFCVQSWTEVNQTLDIGGPEKFTHEEIAKLAFEVLHKKEKTMCIPAGLLKPVLVGMKILSKHNYGLFQFFFNAVTHDVKAPSYGKYRLRDYFATMSKKNVQEL